MANANAPFGLRPIRDVSSGYVTGGARRYSVAAGDGTAIYIGDLVKLAGTGQTIDGNVYPDVIKAATGDTFIGVVEGFVAVTRDSTIYRAASTQRIALVCDDPNGLFAAREGNSGTPLTADDIGLNIDISVVAGSTVTGLSASVLNNTTEATTNTLDLKIVNFVNAPDNAIGLSAMWAVRINRHVLVNQTAGV